MIITQNLLSSTKSKVNNLIAELSYKYSCELGLGKNNNLLLTNIQILNIFKEILCNYKSDCNCNIINNTFDLLLNNLSILSKVRIQFYKNNNAYLYYNNEGYYLTWFYDDINKQINLSPVTTYSNNLITNGSFENGLESWDITPSNDSWVSTSDGAEYNGADEGGTLSQDILTVGKTYNIQLDLSKTTPACGLENSYIEIYAGNNYQRIYNDGESVINITLQCLGNTIFKIFGVDFCSPTGTTIINNIVVKEVLTNYLTLNNIRFNTNCNILNSTDSPLQISIIDNIQLPLEIEGEVNILNSDDEVLLTLTYPAQMAGDYEAIAELWNSTNGYTGWLLNYTNNELRMITPFNNVDYSNFNLEFSQTEEVESEPSVINYKELFTNLGITSTMYNLKPCNEDEIKGENCLSTEDIEYVITYIDNYCL